MLMIKMSESLLQGIEGVSGVNATDQAQFDLRNLTHPFLLQFFKMGIKIPTFPSPAELEGSAQRNCYANAWNQQQASAQLRNDF